MYLNSKKRSLAGWQMSTEEEKNSLKRDDLFDVTLNSQFLRVTKSMMISNKDRY